jgi:hypothetical protein
MTISACLATAGFALDDNFSSGISWSTDILVLTSGLALNDNFCSGMSRSTDSCGTRRKKSYPRQQKDNKYGYQYFTSTYHF